MALDTVTVIFPLAQIVDSVLGILFFDAPCVCTLSRLMLPLLKMS